MMTEHDHDLISAVRNFGEAVVASTKSANFGGPVKSNARRERAAAKVLLAKVLGRKPSDEEVELVIPG